MEPNESFLILVLKAKFMCSLAGLKSIIGNPNGWVTLGSSTNMYPISLVQKSSTITYDDMETVKD